MPLLVACGSSPETAGHADMAPEHEPTDIESELPATDDLLAGTSWLLVQIEGSVPPADTAASIEFQEGRVGGSTGWRERQ